MNKIKNIIAFSFFAILIYSCGDENLGRVNPFADVNYADLAISDNDSIEKFLKTHYFDNVDEPLKLITGSETSLFDDSDRLKSTTVIENEISYKLYVYVTEEGVPDYRDSEDLKENEVLNTTLKSNPTEMDSIFVNRTGIELLNNNLDPEPFDDAEQTWWSLVSTFGIINSAPSPLRGWVKGFPFFKSGKNITNNGPIKYSDTGKGYIFIPGGLAYPSINFQVGQQDPTARPYDRILVFKVELLDIVENTDHDNDGKSTFDEDTDGDGDPANDYSDSNNPTLPNYLNPNFK